MRQTGIAGVRRLISRPTAVKNDAASTRWGLPSLYTVVWNGLDALLMVLCATVAVRFWTPTHGAVSSLHTWHMAIEMEPAASISLLGWFIFCYLFLSNSYGLYRSMHNRSRLNELRLTVQACLIAGLILCGTIYLSRTEAVSRLVVMTTVAACCVALGTRRMVWRAVIQHRFEQGIDKRNVLVVGVGKTAQALRHHLESMHQLGYNFKGFISIGERVLEPLHSVVMGTMDNLLSVARANFVEEIFICAHTDRSELLALVDEASRYGISVRLVPDLYDGLTWNTQMEFIGHFPTVP